jgi:hypothetical protein
MEKNISDIIWVCLWVILPLVPSFLLFKFLPSRGNISGPLQGMQIKFGGAFAGYLILAFLLRPVVIKKLEPKPEYEVWTVEGDVVDNTGKRIPDILHPEIRLVPNYRIERGHFNFKVLGNKVGENEVQFPSMFTKVPNFIDADFPMLNYDHSKQDMDSVWKVNYKDCIAKLKKPVMLSEILNPIVQSIDSTNVIPD